MRQAAIDKAELPCPLWISQFGPELMPSPVLVPALAMAAGEGEVEPVCASSDSSPLQQTQPGCGGKVLPASAFCHVIFHGLLAYEFTICHCQGSFSSPVFLIFFLLPFERLLQISFYFFPPSLSTFHLHFSSKTELISFSLQIAISPGLLVFLLSLLSATCSSRDFVT